MLHRSIAADAAYRHSLTAMRLPCRVAHGRHCLYLEIGSGVSLSNLRITARIRPADLYPM